MNYKQKFKLAYLTNTLLLVGFSLTFGLAEFLTRLDFSAEIIGFIVSLGVLGSIIFKFNVPFFISKFGIKSIWLVSCLLFAVGSALTLLTPYFSFFTWVARVFIISGYGGALISSLAFVQTILPRSQKANRITFFMSSTFLGLLLGSFIGDLTVKLNFDYAIQIQYFLSILAALLSCFIINKIDIKNQQAIQSSPQIKYILKYLKNWKGISSVSVGASFLIVQIYLVQYLFTINITTISYFFIGYTSSAFLSRYLFMKFSLPINKVRYAWIGGLFYSLGQFSFIFLSNEITLVISGVLVGVGRGLLEPVILTLAIDEEPIYDRNNVTASFSILNDIGILFFAPILGFALSNWGFNSVFLITGVFLILPLFLSINILWQKKSNYFENVSLNKIKVLITAKIHKDTVKYLFKDPRFHVISLPDCSRNELIRAIKNTNILICRIETKVDKALIDTAPYLRMVATATTGVNHIAVDYLRDKNIHFCNVPGINSRSTAEFTCALILALTRNIASANESLKKGKWSRHLFTGSMLHNKTIGIIGFGNIGQIVAENISSFGCKIVFYDTRDFSKEELPTYLTKVESLDELLKISDIVTLHAPLTVSTFELINKSTLKLMKKNSFLINTARGELVNEQDLLEALNSNTIGGAALDVWRNEPLINQKLLNHSRVLGTQHIASLSHETNKEISEIIVKNVVNFISRADRIPTHNQKANIINLDNSLEQKIEIINVSTTGICLKLHTELDINAEVILKFIDSDINLNLKVKWVEVVDEFTYFVGCVLNSESNILTETLQRFERRLNKRESLKSSDKIEFLSVLNDQSIVATIHDMDSSGIAVESNNPFEIGGQMSFDFNSVKKHAIVKWSFEYYPGTYRTGLYFIEPLTDLMASA